MSALASTCELSSARLACGCGETGPIGRIVARLGSGSTGAAAGLRSWRGEESFPPFELGRHGESRRPEDPFESPPGAEA